MTYASDIVQQYRLALRDIWNIYFWGSREEKDAELADQFNTLKLPLFNALVLDRLAPEIGHSGRIFGEEYHVVPNLAHGCRARFSSVLIDVGLDNKPGECWKPFNEGFAPADLKVTLLDFFDWTEQSWRDFRYYRVRIQKFESEPRFVGRDALVENFEVDVIWESPVILGTPRSIGTVRVSQRGGVPDFGVKDGEATKP